MSTDSAPLIPALESDVSEKKGTGALRVIGWFSMGMAVAAIGIYLGVEFRSRYRFNRRTPYDFYASAGEQTASEFGMGI
jgi:hypothetical protein